MIFHNFLQLRKFTDENQLIQLLLFISDHPESYGSFAATKRTTKTPETPKDVVYTVEQHETYDINNLMTFQYQPDQYSEPQEFGQTLMCEFPCSQIGGQLVQLRVLEQPQQVEGMFHKNPIFINSFAQQNVITQAVDLRQKKQNHFSLLSNQRSNVLCFEIQKI